MLLQNIAPNPSDFRSAPKEGLPLAIDTAPSRNDPAGFASLLRQNRTAAAPMPVVKAPAPEPLPTAQSNRAPAPSPAPAPAGDDDSGAESGGAAAITTETGSDTTAPAENAPARRTRLLLASRLRAAAETPAETDAADPAAASDAAKKPEPDTKAAAPLPAVDPGVLRWLAEQQRGPVGGAHIGRREVPDSSLAPGGAAARGGTADAADTFSGAAAVLARSDTAAAADDARTNATRADAAGSAERFGAMLGAERGAESAFGQAAGRSEASFALPEAGGVGHPGGWRPPVESTASNPTPAVLKMAAPIDTPQFAQELGLRLSLLARDGLQEAELQLNPAEMGPVSVQITMTGAQAHINFGADLAATRQAIEAGLPELASALRDAGFTLAGGGVSQHAQQSSSGQGGQQGRDGDSPGRRSRGDPVGEEALGRVAGAARRIVTAGGIDLFA